MITWPTLLIRAIHVGLVIATLDLQVVIRCMNVYFGQELTRPDTGPKPLLQVAGGFAAIPCEWDLRCEPHEASGQTVGLWLNLCQVDRLQQSQTPTDGQPATAGKDLKLAWKLRAAKPPAG